MKSHLVGRKILVTGAGGFIGSHLVERLTSQGAQVRAFVRYTSRADQGLLALFPQALMEQIEVVAGDLRDPHAIDEAVAGCDLVFHLGALISIPYSYLHPYEVTTSNVIGTLNVLQACRKRGVNRLVHTSSSEVYGTAIRTPITEEHPLQAQSPYAASKIGADKLAESFHRSYGLPVVIIRPFNTYGPRQSARAVIPTILSQALSRDSLRLGNLEARRDFTYVSDTVEGLICGALRTGIEGRTIHLGSGRDVSIAELVDLIRSLVGKPLTVEVDDRRVRPADSEVMRLISDYRSAAELLDWRPQIELERGLALTMAWVKEHLDRYRIDKYEV